MGLLVPNNVYLIEPVGYLEMIWLEMNCELIVTDSGGVQKEAYFHRRPCITMRNETEWTELVEMGVNCLVGVDSQLIENSLNKNWENINFSKQEVYGEGNAGLKIAEKLREYLPHE
jgi:UDP-GlcNAc3NAcA epimerase